MTTSPTPPALEPLKEYNEPLVEKICEFIRCDGLSDVQAGLLAGADAASIHLWKRSEPRFTERLQRARAEFQRGRLAKMRACAEGGKSGSWRAWVWVAENSGMGTGVEEKEEELAATEPVISPAFVITPAQLAVLQQRRAMARMEEDGE